MGIVRAYLPKKKKKRKNEKKKEMESFIVGHLVWNTIRKPIK